MPSAIVRYGIGNSSSSAAIAATAPIDTDTARVRLRLSAGLVARNHSAFAVGTPTIMIADQIAMMTPITKNLLATTRTIAETMNRR